MKKKINCNQGDDTWVNAFDVFQLHPVEFKLERMGAKYFRTYFVFATFDAIAVHFSSPSTTRKAENV